MVGDEVEEEEEGDDGSATNRPPSAADGCQEEETMEGLLEPFRREELLDFLAEACLRDPALLSRIAASAASDAAHRRLFVHGLGPGATSAALASAFSPFGALDECHAVADRATARCRGYGFVTFRHRSSARRALADASKRVDGRSVACHLASLGPFPERTDRKLFVDKVPPRASHDGLRRFFCEFGEIEAGPLGGSADHATGQFRGYAIFLYKSPEGLTKALEEPRKVFDGCELHCRPAHRHIKKKHASAAPADPCNQRNVTGAMALPISLLKGIASTSAKQPLLASNSPLSNGICSNKFCQNTGEGILGASPLAMVGASSPVGSTSDSHSRVVQSQSSRFSSVGVPTATCQDGQGSRLCSVLPRMIGKNYMISC
jgi:heterogeneous nuclear ribonucleoprotein A1/A3